MRGIEHTHGVCRQTLSAWLKEKADTLPPLETTLTPIGPEQTPVFEMDELCSYVFEKDNKIWVWIALNREAREVIADACGDRSEETCQILLDRIPFAYKKALVFTDYWKAYQAVIPNEQQTLSAKKLEKQPTLSVGIILYNSI